MNDNWPDRFFDWATTSGARIVAIIMGAAILYWVLLFASRRLFKVARKVGDDYVTREQEMRAMTLAGIFRGLLIALLLVVVSLMVLNELGYNVGPLIAGAGIAGLALGFGAQTLVKDMIGGFFILLEGQFNVGDVVQIGSVKGKVEAIRLRTTLVRDGEGVLHVVPNGDMRVVSNLTKGWSRAVIDVQVDYREDLARVTGLLEEVAAKVAADSAVSSHIIEGPAVLGVEKLEGKTVTMRMVAQTEAFRDAEVAREIRRQVAVSLGENNIAVAEAE